jgi:hypothetical protein
MKKLIIFISFFLLGHQLFSQVVFCPPGAEWHFLFGDNNLSIHPSYSNETIKYIGDSVIANETVKVLKHKRFFKESNDFTISKTFLKQNGDTIFMKNIYTNNQWQILYNFAVSAGQGWTNSFAGFNLIDSVKYINVNGFNLKHLYYGTKVIAERFGNYEFLFDYKGLSSDGDYIFQFLCYQDNSFGLKQFSNKSCTYDNPSGIAETENTDGSVILYPNPAPSQVTLEFNSPLKEGSYKLMDVSGKELEINVSAINDSKSSLDLSQLQSGIYFLQVYEKGKLKSVSKLIKD